jgi:hypothetical protein
MITKDQKEILFSELQTHSIVIFACKKAGISKASYYRLIKTDEKFKRCVLAARRMGIDTINDTAESVIIENIKNKDIGAAKYYLEHNNPVYRKKEYPKEIIKSPENMTLADMMLKTIKEAKERKEREKQNEKQNK